MMTNEPLGLCRIKGNIAVCVCTRDPLTPFLTPSTGRPLACSGPPLSAPRRPSSTSPVRRHVVVIPDCAHCAKKVEAESLTCSLSRTPQMSAAMADQLASVGSRAGRTGWARGLTGPPAHARTRPQPSFLARVRSLPYNISIYAKPHIVDVGHTFCRPPPSTDEQTPFSSSTGDVCAIRTYSAGQGDEESYIIGTDPTPPEVLRKSRAAATQKTG